MKNITITQALDELGYESVEAFGKACEESKSHSSEHNLKTTFGLGAALAEVERRFYDRDWLISVLTYFTGTFTDYTTKELIADARSTNKVQEVKS